MADDKEDRIRQRAYEIWEREGRPHGRHEDHWHEASRGAPGDVGAAQPKPRKAASPRKKAAAGGDTEAPAGLSSGLQPGGTVPGGGPGAGMGSLGTGGGSTAGKATGTAGRRKRQSSADGA